MLKLLVILSVLGIVLGLPSNSGVPRLDGRIIGGEETDIDHNPWQLALLYRNQHYCGAVQISPQWAITTAHCLEGAAVEYLSIRAGSTTKSYGGQLIGVKHFIIHSGYNIRTLDYDFALLELKEPISIIPAAPAALPEPNSAVREGETAFITGWGNTSPEGTPTENLHIVEIPVVGFEECENLYYFYELTDRMFCTGYVHSGGKDACQGDSGGPVIIDGRLAGLVSWGTGCALPQYPGVNARISVVLNWIYETIGA